MREVIVRSAPTDSGEADRRDRLVKLLATGLERLFAKASAGADISAPHVDFSGSLSPNGHAPNDPDGGEHLE